MIRTVNPIKAGRLYGKFTPSVAKEVRLVDSKGNITMVSMNRRDRRRILKKVTVPTPASPLHNSPVQPPESQPEVTPE